MVSTAAADLIPSQDPSSSSSFTSMDGGGNKADMDPAEEKVEVKRCVKQKFRPISHSLSSLHIAPSPPHPGPLFLRVSHLPGAADPTLPPPLRTRHVRTMPQQARQNDRQDLPHVQEAHQGGQEGVEVG